MKRLGLLLLLLSACDLTTPIPPTSTTSTSLSTTTTTLESAKNGDVIITKLALKIGNRPFDFKFDDKGIGHLVIGEKGYFTYQTFDGKSFSGPQIVKDSGGQNIPYATKDMRFRKPVIASLGQTTYIFWGEKESDGLRYSKKEGASWTKPIQILGTQWVEYLDVLVFKNTLYLAHTNVDGVLHFTKYDGSKFIEYASQNGNKDVGSYVGTDEAWFMSKFRDASLYPVSDPSKKITLKGAAMPQAVILPGGDYHAAYIVGAIRKLNNNPYYYPAKIVYKSIAKEVNVYEFPNPTDAELLAGSNYSSKWLEVSGNVGISIIGGKPTVIYDLKGGLYAVRIKGTSMQTQLLGNGEAPLVRSLLNSAVLINKGDFSHLLTVQ